MWTRDRSITLSVWCATAMIVLVVLTGVALPLRLRLFAEDVSLSEYLSDRTMAMVLTVYYCFCVPALAALVSTRRILANLRRGVVFDASNVRLLRLISWAALAGGLVCVAGAPVSLAFLAVGLVCGFVGVVMRVVKNLIAAAVDLKAENDLTI